MENIYERSVLVAIHMKNITFQEETAQYDHYILFLFVKLGLYIEKMHH